MTRPRARDIASSVRQRLLDLSRTGNEDFQLIITRFASERLLYRLSQSNHAERFILKGALLFALWTGRMLRPTRDVDLLGHGTPGAEDLAAVFREVCALELDHADGLRFHAEFVRTRNMKESGFGSGLRWAGPALISRSTSALAMPLPPPQKSSTFHRCWVFRHHASGHIPERRSSQRNTKPWSSLA